MRVRITMGWGNTQRWHTRHKIKRKKTLHTKEFEQWFILCTSSEDSRNRSCSSQDISHGAANKGSSALHDLYLHSVHIFLTRLPFYKIISLPRLLFHSGITTLSINSRCQAPTSLPNSYQILLGVSSYELSSLVKKLFLEPLSTTEDTEARFYFWCSMRISPLSKWTRSYLEFCILGSDHRQRIE